MPARHKATSTKRRGQLDTQGTLSILLTHSVCTARVLITPPPPLQTSCSDLQADHLVGLVNERNMYDDPDDRTSVYGSAAATDTRSSNVGGWNVEVNRQSKSAAQSQAYGAPTDIMAEMHGSGGHEGATMPGLIGSTSV